MSVEPPELVALKRALGRQLAAARQAAEIGQQQVAHKSGYSRPSIAHAEAGRQLLTRDFWKTVDELVGAEGELMAEYERVLAAKQQYEARSREMELARAYAQAKALRATTAPYVIEDADQRLSVRGAPEVVAGIALPVGVELVEGCATPLDYLTFLSSAARCTSGEQRDRI